VRAAGAAKSVDRHAAIYYRVHFTMKLILFDIDSTLVRVARPVIRELTRTLLAAVDHHEPLDAYELHGKTDRQVIRELRAVAGVDADTGPDAHAMERLIIAFWHTHLSRDTVELLPGVVALLEDLRARGDVALGVLTGNLEEGARLKLAIHGLDEYFRFGAYGSDADNRIDLPPIALRRARAAYGVPFESSSTLVVGDSNRDIDCARAWGLRTLAVATGSLDVQTLREHGPDAAVETLLDRSYLDTFLRE
jgi:phosphoglycolate phosphatase-like HAD superfamily hydrolase